MEEKELDIVLNETETQETRKNELIEIITADYHADKLRELLSDYHANDVAQVLSLITQNQRARLYTVLSNLLLSLSR